MKLHLVSTGDFSDYRVCGVYSTKEKAEEALKLYPRGFIEDGYELDVTAEHPPGMFRFIVSMDANGDTQELYQCDPDHHVAAGSVSTYSGGSFILTNVWAESETHAVKIVNEIRAQLIATNQWPTE